MIKSTHIPFLTSRFHELREYKHNINTSITKLQTLTRYTCIHTEHSYIRTIYVRRRRRAWLIPREISKRLRNFFNIVTALTVVTFFAGTRNVEKKSVYEPRICEINETIEKLIQYAVEQVEIAVGFRITADGAN